MGLVSEISDLLRSAGRAVRKGPELVSSLSGMAPNVKSITHGAKDSTFQFPCLISNTVPTDMAATVTRLLDLKYAQLTQSWLSMNSMFDVTIDPTPLSYLKKFHTNIRFESANEDDYRLYMNEDKTVGVLFNTAYGPTTEMVETHKDYLKEYMSDFDLSPLENVLTEDAAGRNSMYDTTDALLQSQAVKNSIDKQKALADMAKNTRAPKLLDRDVKKNNDLTPYGIEVRLIAVNDKKEFVQYVDIVLGIKTILHLIESDDMVANIGRALQNRSLGFKFLRWTTGEISLLKDIILNLDSIKMDSIDRNNKNNPYFSTLKKLKAKKVGIRNLTVPHAILPTATIVLSQVEVDYLSENFGVDLRKSSIAKKLLDSLFLMAFIIIDEGTGTVSIFDDGDSNFQTYSIEALERDQTLNSNKMGKEIGRMIAR